MSTVERSLSANNENVENIRKEKSTLSTNLSSERKTLKTLQVGPDGKLIGSEKKKPGQKKIDVSKRPIKVFVDRKKTWLEIGTQTDKTSVHETEVQTEISGVIPAVTSAAQSKSHDLHNDSGVDNGDIDLEAYDLMVKEPIPEHYWRDLAEERRCSLAEALSENEMLHQSMEELKEENHNLSLLASQAEYLASVLNDVLGDKKDNLEDSVQEKREESKVEVEQTNTAQQEGNVKKKEDTENTEDQ